jgi:glyoxylase-like metal-dependent hydrolase (beta-lactamase superfamily II)/rhodanese-related sulfurtransferase
VSGRPGALIFRQLFDALSSTYSYLLVDAPSRQAVLIDPVWDQFVRDAALLRELGVRLVFTLETHVHADHVTAAWLFQQKLGSRIGVSAKAGAAGADRLLDHGDTVAFGGESLQVRATPGHTGGCLTYVTADHAMAFTGDALLVRGAGRTDFQQGDARTLYRSVYGQIFTLPDRCLLYPGHDYAGRTATSVGEERAHNPRLGGARSEDDFAGYMANLGLPHPKQMELAVPANLQCGRPAAGGAASQVLPAEIAWGPVVRTYAGVPTIEPEWVAQHLAEVTILDVREPDEFDGELGHIVGARLIPLGQLRGRLSEVPAAADDDPVVIVCRSGGRSAAAAAILEKAGATRVANISGGMVQWHSLSLPLA